MSLLDQLNECNDVTILSVEDEAFASYGRIISGFDVSEMLSVMEQTTPIPEEGNCYVASVEDLEELAVSKELQQLVYGDMPIQVGYCNGRNSTYNGFEYHKGSEINIAVCDFMLVLGHSYEIKDLSYDIKQAQVFFVPKGTIIEMYQTTLHLSPLKVSDEGFRDVVILPRGTNTPLSDDIKRERDNKIQAKEADEELQMLLQRNKWVIAHPDREPLIKQGALAGVKGENKEVFYPKGV